MKQVLTNATCNKFAGLHFCCNHTGKMTGIFSLSTSPILNPHCQKRAKTEGSICEKCYAIRQIKLQKINFPESLERNSVVLADEINKKSLPVIPIQFFRFESFGDLFCNEQVKTYFKLCYKNPNTHFALWTKNPKYIQNVLNEGMKKPDNLNIILSSTKLNERTKTKYEFVDKIFTVYSKKYANENGIKINCGSKLCISCGICYRKNFVKEVNEILK